MLELVALVLLLPVALLVCVEIWEWFYGAIAAE